MHLTAKCVRVCACVPTHVCVCVCVRACVCIRICLASGGIWCGPGVVQELPCPGQLHVHVHVHVPASEGADVRTRQAGQAVVLLGCGGRPGQARLATCRPSLAYPIPALDAP